MPWFLCEDEKGRAKKKDRKLTLYLLFYLDYMAQLKK